MYELVQLIIRHNYDAFDVLIDKHMPRWRFWRDEFFSNEIRAMEVLSKKMQSGK